MLEALGLLLMAAAFLAAVIVPSYLIAISMYIFTGSKTMASIVFCIMLLLATAIVLREYTLFAVAEV